MKNKKDPIDKDSFESRIPRGPWPEDKEFAEKGFKCAACRSHIKHPNDLIRSMGKSFCHDLCEKVLWKI